MGSRCFPRTGEKCHKTYSLFTVNSTAKSLILVKTKQCFLVRFFAIWEHPPCVPIWGHFCSLIICHTWRTSLRVVLYSLIERSFDVHFLAWMWPDRISHSLVESPQWPEVGVKFLCSMPVSPCCTKPRPGASSIRVFLAETNNLISLKRCQVLFSVTSESTAWIKWSWIKCV